MVEISIIIPAHNVADYVAETLDSLLVQDDADFEVLLIDDGSTDTTLSVLQRYEAQFHQRKRQCTVLSQKQGGAGSARNAGLRRATGRLIGFLDADDLLHPGALTALIETIGTADCDLVFPLCRHVDLRGQPTGVTSRIDRLRFSAEDLLRDNPIHSGSGVVIAAERAAAIGLFDVDLPACIDLDYWVRLTEGRGKTITAVDRVLVDYRTRPGQITGSWKRMRVGWEAVVAGAIQRDCVDLSRLDGEARARNLLVWATAAYKNREFAEARRLMAECWRTDPVFAISDQHARVRSAAVLASLLPPPLHRTLQAQFNG
ncbi:glycosyltransferase [Erythrobacter litoralis]|uniref:glycosyltransferase n=1 Tax=Erythrobacter litoralis TaxID=39960 RepID=UPI0024353ADB|nr:glycosyltransferase [Erythrobacter litoralis]MDG6078811.1 glycosyltransferase [Erythrobacter litoralis]